MTTPTPIWSDVSFDHVAAEAAASECESMAARLRAADVQRRAHASIARREWQGRRREEFDRAEAALDDRSRLLDAELRRVAAAIRTASASARFAQARREADRAEWLRSGVEPPATEPMPGPPPASQAQPTRAA